MSEWTKVGWGSIQYIIGKSEYDYSDDFVNWLQNNKDIWLGFANKAVIAHRGDHKTRFGAKAILEILRWETFLSDSGGVFKINNNYAPDLARLVMDCRPEMNGYFQIRGSAYRGDAE